MTAGVPGVNGGGFLRAVWFGDLLDLVYTVHVTLVINPGTACDPYNTFDPKASILATILHHPEPSNLYPMADSVTYRRDTHSLFRAADSGTDVVLGPVRHHTCRSIP